MSSSYCCIRFFVVMLFLGLVGPAFRTASAQHPNYQPTAGYLDLLFAIDLLEKDTSKIDESTRNELLAEGRALKRLEESYANGSQPLIKRFAEVEKQTDDLAKELEQLTARQKQIAADQKRTQVQVDAFNKWRANYNARATYQKRVFDQLVAWVNADNKRLEEKYAAFTSRVKSFTNPAPLKISTTVQNMVASKSYEADGKGTKCSHFVNDFAKNIYNYNGFEKKDPEGTTEPLLANAIIKTMQDGNGWKRIYDDPKWDNQKKPSLQAAFKTAAHYAGDGDLVIVGFKTGEPNVPNAHVAIVMKGDLVKESTAWSQAGIGELEFPMIGQAGKNVFANKTLTQGITADDLKKYGMVIYVLKDQ